MNNWSTDDLIDSFKTRTERILQKDWMELLEGIEKELCLYMLLPCKKKN